MSHSFSRIWLHIVFSTQGRKPLISPIAENTIFEYMRKLLLEEKCPVRIINGMSDHVHLLFLHNPNKTIADTIKQIQESTSNWINQNEIIEKKFAWQKGYGVFSVSESRVEKVFKYIENQKAFHRKTSFTDEYNKMMELYDRM
ncbi:MAG: IS200/IS605 family transposase [Bacteroidetes bacterium]|nr:IS200/IS605 family transposase [Bacteroidota bacterium]